MDMSERFSELLFGFWFWKGLQVAKPLFPFPLLFSLMFIIYNAQWAFLCKCTNYAC